jgi:acetoin utilization deacetylase AcuC-like enzyme
MKVFYCDQFVLPLPPNHRFPMAKYRLLRERVEQYNRGQYQLCIPEAAKDGDILLAHDAAYLQKVVSGGLSEREIRALGFPWSERLVERSRRSSGATIGACRAALEDGAGANLAGGTHHAFRDSAQGYCLFNDSAIAARAMLRDRLVKRALIADCDVHQGNGTASILRDDPSVFTFSIHGANNFPARKERSDLDIELADGTTDAAYLEALDAGVRRAIDQARPELVIYLAGADPFEGDRLGRLKITKAGLAARDDLVYGYCRGHGLPVAVVMGGGYAHNIHDIVDIHYQSVERAAHLCAAHGRQSAVN